MGQDTGHFSPQLRRGSVLRAVQNSRGQIIIEYMLLLVVAVSIASLLVKRLAARDDANPGIIIKKWCEIQKLIKDDNPGNRTNPPAMNGCD